MTKLKTTLIIIITCFMVFATSFLSVIFYNNYQRAIEKTNLNNKINHAYSQNAKYQDFLEQQSSKAIKQDDFTTTDQEIFQLVQDNKLAALDISTDDHILAKQDHAYTCQLTLMGSMDNLENFLKAFTHAPYLVNIQSLDFQPVEDGYLVKIKYLLYIK